jgi:hypothetical protein
MKRSLVLHMIEANRRKRGNPVPRNFDQTVQSALQQFCVQSDVFKNKGKNAEDGLFHWPQGKRAGVWAVYPDRAENWLRRKQLEASLTSPA